MTRRPLSFWVAVILCVGTGLGVVGTIALRNLPQPGPRLAAGVLLNKDAVDGAPPTGEPVEVRGYVWQGELPPYRHDAPWCYKSAGRKYIDHLPRTLLQSLFFNTRERFEAFANRYKGQLKLWLAEGKEEDLSGEAFKSFLLARLNENVKSNRSHLQKTRGGLSEEQYRILNTMNLVHGNYVFAGVNHPHDDIMWLLGTPLGDCNEYADLLTALLRVQKVEANSVSYHFSFIARSWGGKVTFSPKFDASHCVVHAGGMLVDATVNIAFDLQGDFDMKDVPRQQRLTRLIETNRVYGFYNWLLKPDVREEVLAGDTDGGILAFYYYYYLYGVGTEESTRTVLPYPIRPSQADP